MSRDTIGINPLDSLTQSVEPVKQQTKAKKKERITIALTPEVIERLKNAVYWSPGLTLSCVIEQATEKAILDLERKNGKPFPERNGELKKGRQLS